MHKHQEGILGGMLLLTVVAFLGGYIVKDYNDRMNAYNAHVCATYGMQADCVTPAVAANN